MKSNLQIRSLYKYQCLFKRTRANNSQLVRRHKKQSHLEKMLKTSQCLYQTIGHKNNCQKKKKPAWRPGAMTACVKALTSNSQNPRTHQRGVLHPL